MQEQIRNGIRIAVCSAGGGHAGGSLSIADILASLYGSIMKHDPAKPDWEERDRLILSKGHSGIGLYAALAVNGYFPVKELEKFAAVDSRLMNHPDAHSIPGVEMSTGSLGHGFPLAVGISLAGKMRRQEYFTYCIVGDGECCEGSIWEAAMAAGFRKLTRLVVVVDRNTIGNDGLLDKMVDLEPMADKWRAFGFKTSDVNGHDVEALNAVFMKQRREVDGPYAVIAHTVKGKGLIESIAGTGDAHYLSGNYEAIQHDFSY